MESSSASVQPAPPPKPSVPYSWRDFHPTACVTYVRDHRQADDLLQRLNRGPYGFDLEWKPTFTKGQAQNRVALIQIANDQTILLLQVSAMQQFPSKLYDWLLDPKIIKVGVGIQDDAKKLYKDWNANLKNCVDLALLARTVDNKQWKGRYTNPLGLARLVATYLYRELVKGRITRSNWERVLTRPQQTYAANDAHAGYVIYVKLMAMLSNVSPPPSASCYTFDTTNGALCIPSRKTPWKALNPNYDPGPLPPSGESKPSKQNNPNKQTMNSPEVASSQTRLPDTQVSLPVPQSVADPPGPSFSYIHGEGRAFAGAPLPPHNTLSGSRLLSSQSDAGHEIVTYSVQ